MGNRHTTSAATAVLLALVSVSCGADEGAEPQTAPTSQSSSTATATATAPTPSSEGTPTPKPPKATGTEITSATSDFGQVLWGPDRQVVYIWEKEPNSRAECYDDCAEAWPPVLTKGKPVATGDVNAGLLGTTTRQDGSTQVTYNDHPLYYYAHEGPGEVKCHNIATHGGLWWVVTPSGTRAA